MGTDIVFEDQRWADLGLQTLADAAINATLTPVSLDPEDWSVSLLACDDARIAALNTEFRDKSGATNVLSWPSAERGAAEPGDEPDPPEDPDGELGDIAIAYETCAREAAESGKPFVDHATHLVVHATLHLLGYDHIRDQDATLMERYEIEILGKLGLPDPY
jgi:probable rRNA maturation factor